MSKLLDAAGRLVLATTNRGKAAELAALLPHLRILTLEDVGFTDDIAEPYDSFAGNARAKARAVWAATGIPTLADDSGLCVDALGGGPGVHSARYAGEPQDAARNVAKLLEELQDVDNRRAHFAAALCLCSAAGEHVFEGRCYGTIAHAPAGAGGFGYDPVFIPEGYSQTFSELPAEIKAGISHRARAMSGLREALPD